MTTFRLIQSGFNDAAANMAVDEAIFSCYRQGVSIPTLRLYGWNPASFSIGVSQDARLLSLGSAYVRRPTGGGALFHENELTYSLVAATADLNLSSNVKGSYATICSFLIETYRALGLKAGFAKDANPPGALRSHTIAPLCQMRSEEYDILVNGVKFGGNAQKRRRDVFLQHGALPLGLISEAREKPVSFEELSEITVKAFSRQFNAVPEAGTLSEEEIARSQQCRTEKYANDAWNAYGHSDAAPARVA